jgi:hypothetical protein
MSAKKQTDAGWFARLLKDVRSETHPDYDREALLQGLRFVGEDVEAGLIPKPTTHAGLVTALLAEFKANEKAWAEMPEAKRSALTRAAGFTVAEMAAYEARQRK